MPAPAPGMMAPLRTPGLVAGLVALFLVFSSLPSYADPPAVVGAGIDPGNREAVAAAYRDVYLPAVAVTAPDPPADAVSQCQPGEALAGVQAATLQLVNYFRSMSGVEPVVFDGALSAKAQQAALMMYANNQLDHDPPSSWRCYTAEGADAAGHSNLALGPNGASVVRGYMDDPGATNDAAGHRWWLQRPAARSMGNGAVGTANALWVTGDDPAVDTPAFTSWPSAGFFPAQLDPAGRWSFTATDPSYDLRAATVAVVGPDGQPVTTTAYPVGAYGSLVFQVGALSPPAGSTVDDYRVSVSNLKVDGRAVEPYTYTVSMFDPTAPVTPSPVPVLAVKTDPTVTGTARVGSTLLAQAPTWSEDGVATTYQWLRDGQPVSGAQTTRLTLTPADVGHRISVRTVGTKTGFAAATAVSVGVGPVQSPATISVAASSPGRGKLAIAVTLTAPGEAALGGTVKITEGTKTLAAAVAIKAGRGAFNASNLTSGRHTYTVSYAGSDRVAPATRDVAVAVAAKNRPVVRLQASSPAVGKVTIKIGVTAPDEGALGGTVTVKEGSKVRAAKLKVTKGAAVFQASKVASGAHTYEVTYNGTSRVLAGSQSVQVTVKAKVASTLSLTGSSPAAKKIKIVLRVTAAGGGSPGGTATIKDGKKTVKSKLKISKGKASFSASKIKPGQHTYKVSYSGTSEVKASSATIKIKVKAPVKLKSYKNCTAMHEDYPHGVGRTDAEDQTSGDPVTNFFRNNALYSRNDGRDRDKDGVACESH